MGFLWPQHLNETPGAAARAGRALHWALLILAALVAVFGLTMMVSTHDKATVAGLGALVALAGRGLRYVLAAE